MDRSFLSAPSVVAASRSFVCIRIPTYEDEFEMSFLRRLYTGRSGDVENTTFTILSPDGARPLTRVSRSPRQVFADAAEMAQSMRAIAGQYSRASYPSALPIAADVRLGLDIAASDRQLLVLIVSSSKARVAAEAEIAKLAWSDEFIGKFAYARASSAQDLAHIKGVAAGACVAIIEPDEFGEEGTVVGQVKADQLPDVLQVALRTAIAAHFVPPKNTRAHRQQGVVRRMFWETKLPVTDPEEAAARARTKELMDRRR